MLFLNQNTFDSKTFREIRAEALPIRDRHIRGEEPALLAVVHEPRDADPHSQSGDSFPVHQGAGQADRRLDQSFVRVRRGEHARVVSAYLSVQACSDESTQRGIDHEPQNLCMAYCQPQALGGAPKSIGGFQLFEMAGEQQTVSRLGNRRSGKARETCQVGTRRRAVLEEHPHYLPLTEAAH